jgi:negative regulator of flagellin synthesis FlgM
MIDRIGGTNGFGPGGVDESEKRTRPADARPDGSGRDRLDLSDSARRTAALADRARELPDVRQERVDALRLRLEDGTYSVDPRRVARAILELEDAFRSR